MSTSTTDDLELDVADVAAGGDGIAHASDGRIVFVHGAIPGDRVRARVLADRPRMLKAQVAEVLEPAPGRVAPPCPHVADGCGGCGWQHVDLDEQRRLKVRLVEESLRRIGRIEHPVELAPALPATGFRTTVRGLVEEGRFAFRTEHGHDAVPVDRCLIAHSGLDELIHTVDFGAVDEVTLRIGGATGERLARFDRSVPDGLALPDDVITVGADQLRSGHRAWFHDEVAGRRFRISADSFFQTRTDGAAALVEAVREAGEGRWGSGRMIDLYGGVGLFAATLGQGMHVTLVESSKSSAADARHNLGDLDAKVLRLPVAKWRPSSADVVVADPPRAGLGKEAVASVAATGAERMVLVSCDAAAFGRDAGLLREAGWSLTSAVLVDLFPHTPHVEIVSRYDRIAAA